MNYKRRIAFLLIAFTVFSLWTFGCNFSIELDEEQSDKPNAETSKILEGFSVHYLDVGNGDCIFIRLNDGKTVLIDCAEPDQKKAEYVTNFLRDYGTEKIDYFIITHPDADHIGNAPEIIEEFSVGELYLPHLSERISEYFPILERVITLASAHEISVKTNNNFKSICGNDYSLIFLTPYPYGIKDSSYNDINGVLIPDQANVNDISPIIYLESEGARFVFTGDASSSQEKLALKVLVDPVFNLQLQNLGVSVNLSGVDFLKLGHHGASTSSCLEFLQTLAPKNAVVSVSGENYYGHPNTEVLERLEQANPDYKLFRTDVHGTISVGVTDGKIKIMTDKIE